MREKDKKIGEEEMYKPDEQKVSSKIKTLKKQLKNVSGTEKIDILNKLAGVYFDQSPVTALEYSKEAIQLAREIDYRQGEALALRSIGNVHFQLGDYAEAFPNYRESLKIEKEMNHVSEIAGLLSNIGMLHALTGATEKALKSNMEAMELLEKTGSKDNIKRIIFNNIGNCYFKLEYYNNALEFYKRSQTICEEMDDQRGVAFSLSNSALVFQKQGKFDEAVKYYRKALDIRRKLKYNYGLSSTLLKMGNCIMESGEIKRGKKYLKEGLLIAEKGNFKDIIKDGLRFISTVLEREKKYKEALDYQKRFSELRNTLYNEENSRIMAKMQAQFDLKQKVKEIETLTENRRILEEKIQERTKELSRRKEELELEINKRVQTEQELKKHRDHLGELVKERTKELEEKNKKLEEFNDLFVDREFRIKELKDKVKELEKKLE